MFMEGLLVVVLFFLGLSVGSFVNVVIDRFNPEKNDGFLKIVSGRSRCDGCQGVLKPHELIPVLSFLVQKGRSRCCYAELALHYPLMEFSMGGLFVFIGYALKVMFAPLFIGSSGLFFIVLLFWLFFMTLFIALACIDAHTYFLPDFLMIPGIIISFFYVGFLSMVGQTSFYYTSQDHLLGALLFGGFLYFIYLISRGRAMGFGDVKLGVFGGLLLGGKLSALALFLSFILGALMGVILLMAKKKGFKEMIPFGPFIILGIFIAFFFGGWILSWYFGLIGI